MKHLLIGILCVGLLAGFGCGSSDSGEEEYTPDNTSTQFESGPNSGADTTGGESGAELDAPVSDE